MNSDTSLLSRYLKQHQELFGNDLYFDPSTENEKSDNKFGTPLMSLNALNEFHDSISNCRECFLADTRTNLVVGAGNPNADLVFVGEAPGRDEDLKGEPFVGRAGKLLDKILAAIELAREDVYILNVLKCRPPKNRDPLSSEVEKCELYLKEQLNIIKPKLIVALGRVAAKTLLRIEEPLGKMREKIYLYEGIDTIVTYHPAALLRNPNFKKPTWEDFKKIRDKYLTGK